MKTSGLNPYLPSGRLFRTVNPMCLGIGSTFTEAMTGLEVPHSVKRIMCAGARRLRSRVCGPVRVLSIKKCRTR